MEKFQLKTQSKKISTCLVYIEKLDREHLKIRSILFLDYTFVLYNLQLLHVAAMNFS